MKLTHTMQHAIGTPKAAIGLAAATACAGLIVAARRRMAALAAVLCLIVVAAGASPAVASVSGSQHWPTPGRVSSSGLSLTQAPNALHAAVRATLGTPVPGTAGIRQQAELTAPHTVAGEAFGGSVAISGNTAVVGAPQQNSFAGAAYVFTRSRSGHWTRRAELTAADSAAGDYFGGLVAISKSTIVVTSLRKNSDTGAAYVYTGSGRSWHQRAELTAADGAPGDYFGVSVAIARSTIVVGAFFHNSHTGAAYVFTGSGADWSQRAELTPPDGVTDADFGNSVAISGNTIVVGADAVSGATGAAYVFTGSGASWTQQAELTAANGGPADYFGTVVAIAGDTVVATAPPVPIYTDTGAAYVFTRSGTSWSQQAELTASNGTPNADFGSSVTIADSTIVVGALHFTSPGIGAAYMYTGSGTSWPQTAELTAPDGATGNYFGISVAISHSTTIVGADGANSTTGAAYVYTGV